MVPTATPPTPATYTKAQATRNVHALFDSERGALKASLNMVVVGHVDAGKSTLMGHTLLDLGEVSKRTMHGYERDSLKMGKASFKFAWVLDETGEERERGITMDVGSVRFETESKSVSNEWVAKREISISHIDKNPTDNYVRRLPHPTRSPSSTRPATRTLSRT